MSHASTRASVQKQFGPAANAYATSAIHASGADLAVLLEAAAASPGTRALDLGCGAGHTALGLAMAGADVVAIDLTDEMLAAGRRLAAERGLANVEFRRADAGLLPFADGEFDIVTSRLSAHHYPDPQQALCEAARVLKPGGTLLLADCIAPEDAALDTFLQTFEFLRDPSHVRDWRTTEWLRMFEAAGLSARAIHRHVIAVEGEPWFRRMSTPPSKQAIIRELFREATPAQVAAFEIRNDEPWGFSLPEAIVEGVKAS